MTALLVSACGELPGKAATLDEIDSRALSYSGSPAKDLVVAGINAFAVDLYVRLAAKDSGNLFFAPFSIESALAMTWAGAKGSTADQMAKALHFGADQEGFHEAFGALVEDIGNAGSREGYELSTANSLWVQSGFTLLETFTSILSASYGALLHPTDFQGASETSRLAINDWTATQTKARIPDLLPPGSIDAGTRLVLANALYFKGSWARTFPAADTSQAPFNRARGDSIEVPMMRQSAQFRFGASGGTKALELPYTTGDISMLLILPEDPAGLAALEADLQGGIIDRLVAAMSAVDGLEILLPRFGFAASFALRPELESLGMTDAFTDSADFTGIAASPPLSIGDVYHKSFVLVDEEGTEAAAATAVTVGVTAMLEGFRADHPFIFLIRHNRSGAILFMGRVVDPSATLG